jgi:O-antigen ligase
MTAERWFLVCLGAIACGLGALIPEASGTVVLAVSLTVVTAVVAVVVWRLITRIPRFRGLPTGLTLDDGRYGDARKLVYAGLLTSCWLQLRLAGVTVSDALFLVALAWAVVENVVTNDDRRRFLPRGLWFGVLLFVTGGAISTVADSSDKLSSAGVILRVFYLIVAWFWLGGMTLRTTDHIWRALKFWVASAAVCGAWALGQKYGHLPGNLDQNRFAGLADHVNDLGALTACALVPSLALAYRDRRWLLAVIGIGVGLTLSASIGGGIAALVALSFGLLSRDLTRAVATALVVGSAALIFASPLIGSSAITRFSTSTNSSAQFGQDTLDTRIRTYEGAWARIKMDPFIGTGLDARSSEIFDDQNDTAYEVHNLFLGRWLDSGILGFLGMIVLVGTLGKLGWQLIGLSPDRYLALTLFAAFIAYIGDEMSEPSLYKRYSLVPALLIIALRATTLRAPPQIQPGTPSVDGERVLVAA